MSASLFTLPTRRQAPSRRGRPDRRATPAAPVSPDRTMTPERRMRESMPEDRALYACSCGSTFTARVSTSVCCPACGDDQAW